MKWKRNLLEILPIVLFAFSVFSVGTVYGIQATRKDLIPVPSLRYAFDQIDGLLSQPERHWSISLPGGSSSTRLLDNAAVAPGLILITGMSEELVNFARIVDRTGAVIHEYRPDWFEFPTDDLNLPDRRRPQSAPGTTMHGAIVMSNGDLVFNFGRLATARIDACGGLRWILDNLGHHSIELDDDGNLWVPSERVVPTGTKSAYPNHAAPLRDYTIQKISLNGEILRTISVIDILLRNDLLGLLHLSSLNNRLTSVSGDTLHLNDVEVFPRNLPEGVFKHGDLMISLRNINTVLVVDPNSLDIRYRTTGAFLRHHDPDFVSGDRFIVFDNRNLNPNPAPVPRRSRILEIDAARDSIREIYVPQGEAKFFTEIMGKHQVLPNGNLMIAASLEGRAIEVTPAGRMVWEYVNELSGGNRGIITEATVLPRNMGQAFFEKRQQRCEEPQVPAEAR